MEPPAQGVLVGLYSVSNHTALALVVGGQEGLPYSITYYSGSRQFCLGFVHGSYLVAIPTLTFSYSRIRDPLGKIVNEYSSIQVYSLESMLTQVLDPVGSYFIVSLGCNGRTI